jgi:signal transduction histidine kinase
MLISRFGWSGHIWRQRVARRKADSPAKLTTPVAGGEGRVRKALVGRQSEQRPGFTPSSNNASLAGFAHELKTPLAIICGYVEVLLDGTLGPLNENQQNALREATANCSRLKKLVEGFLSQGAFDAQQVTMHLELADLNKCLADACGFWQQQVQAKNMALYFQPDPTIEPFIFDYDKIQHAVSNLLDNAIKFTPSGGTVWLTPQRSRIESNAGDDAAIASGEEPARGGSVPAIKVVVADTGPGIPGEFRREVFEEFFRIPNKTNSEGSGLGLSIAERLVQAHGGRIWVESEPGAGTRVSFLIPARHEPDSTFCEYAEVLRRIYQA